MTSNVEDTIDPIEFIDNPRKIIAERLFKAYGFKDDKDDAPIDGDWKVSKVLKKCVADESANALIPEINHSDGKIGIESIQEGKLCRFRCVVQDMRDPEYYVGCFTSKRRNGGANSSSSSGEWQTTKFAEHGGDELSRMEEEEGGEENGNDSFFNFENPQKSSNVRMWERKVFYCVPIPGEAKWAQQRDCLVESGAKDGDGVKRRRKSKTRKRQRRRKRRTLRRNPRTPWKQRR